MQFCNKVWNLVSQSFITKLKLSSVKVKLRTIVKAKLFATALNTLASCDI